MTMNKFRQAVGPEIIVNKLLFSNRRLEPYPILVPK